MNPPSSANPAAPSLRDLYPEMNEAELRQAEENLERYLALVLRIFDRVRGDPQAYAQLKARLCTLTPPAAVR